MGQRLKLNDDFRRKILRVFLVFAVIVCLVEIVVGIVFANTGQLADSSIWNYVFVRTLLPTALNFGMLFFVYYINENERFEDETKQLAVILAITGFCYVVVIFHSYYSGIVACLALPMCVAMLIGSKKMYKLAYILSIIGTLIHFYIQTYDYLFWNGRIDYIIANFFVCMICLGALYFIGQDFIDMFEKAILFMLDEYQKVKKENWNVVHDETTGLFNSLVLDIKVKDNVKMYKENKIKKLCVAFIEFDNIKDINTSYGQDVGDTIIKLFGTILNDEMTENLMISKNENDRYSLLAIDKDISALVDIVKNIKDEVYNSDNVMINEGKLTFSTGISEYDGVCSSDEFLSNGEKALRQAKENGKNQTVVVR